MWITGFNYVYNSLNYFYRKECQQNNIPIPSSMNDFLIMLNRHKDDLKNYLIRSLCESGLNPSANISFEEFKKWAKNDNPVIIEYAGKSFGFATNLNFLYYIGLNINQ
ncbi:MAG: hypothetical protein MJ252_06970 [archaeon]|nr:hypothetical protein [archaeon]